MTDLIASLFYNRREGRLRGVPRFLVFAVVLVITVLAGSIGYFSLAVQLGLTPVNVERAAANAYVGLFLFVGYAALTGFVLLLLYLSARYLERRPFQSIGYAMNRSWWIDFLAGSLLGAFLMALIFTIELGMGWIKIDFAWASIGILGPLLFFLLVSVQEEALTRGYMLLNIAETLRFRFWPDWVPVTLAFVFSSLVFGFMHANNPNATWISSVSLVIAGFGLALPYIWTGELGFSFGWHWTWNFVQGHVFGFPVSGNHIYPATFFHVEQLGEPLWTGGAFGPEAGLLGIGIEIVGMLLIALYVRLRYGSVRIRLKLYSVASKQPNSIPASD